MESRTQLSGSVQTHVRDWLRVPLLSASKCTKKKQKKTTKKKLLFHTNTNGTASLFSRGVDFDKWLSLWHHQTLGPGSERSLLGQHLLQSSCSGHWHCTLEHDPQQRGSAHCQGFCTCTDIMELIKTAATLVSKYLHISTLTCSRRPLSVFSL